MFTLSRGCWTFCQTLQSIKPSRWLLAFYLCLVLMQWILVTMAHRRFTQSAPSYISERDADGTRVVRLINFSSGCQSACVERHECECVFRIRLSQTGATVQDHGSGWKNLQPPGSGTDPQTTVKKDIFQTVCIQGFCINRLFDVISGRK